MINQADAIRTYLLKQVRSHPVDIVAVAAKHFGVTRTTIHRHLTKLIKEHAIIKTGTTRDIKYFSTSSLDREMNYKIGPKLSEFDVFDNDFKNIFAQFSENIYDICSYGFTEIFNNAIDHSQGTSISSATTWKNNFISLRISDNGIGVFKNIYNYFNLDDMRESILQLNKGKTTTDPVNHTGEGIFFCARVFDIFEIYANGLHYVRDNIENDWAIQSIPNNSDSSVIMTLNVDSDRQLVDVFKTYQDPESFAFDRTDILVELSRFGEEKLISHSQAKRITRSLEKFRIITLDFTNVKLLGQGFADEIFRVYANKHPEITIKYINANNDVEFMIKRSLATAQQPDK